MCFSTQADLVAGAALVPLGVLSLRQVRAVGDVPLAALPLLFGAHQLVEALVWAGVDGDVSAGLARAAAWVYAVFALVAVPLLVPVAVLLVEERHRRRVVPFFVLGAVVAVLMTATMLDHGLRVVAYDHALGYHVGLGRADWLSTALYVVAVVGSCLAASSWTLRAFGVVNLVGLVLVALAFADSLASTWCVFAAASSVLVLVHMVHRAHTHDDRVSSREPATA